MMAGTKASTYQREMMQALGLGVCALVSAVGFLCQRFV